VAKGDVRLTSSHIRTYFVDPGTTFLSNHIPTPKPNNLSLA